MRRRQLTFSGALMTFALGACSGGAGHSAGLGPTCTAPRVAMPVTCDEAVLIAQAVALSHHVVAQRPNAEVKPEAVAEGRSVSAWWVTFDRVVYRPPSGGRCVPRSYAVVVNAVTGQLLAFDDPAPDC